MKKNKQKTHWSETVKKISEALSSVINLVKAGMSLFDATRQMIIYYL